MAGVDGSRLWLTHDMRCGPEPCRRTELATSAPGPIALRRRQARPVRCPIRRAWCEGCQRQPLRQMPTIVTSRLPAPYEFVRRRGSLVEHVRDSSKHRTNAPCRNPDVEREGHLLLFAHAPSQRSRHAWNIKTVQSRCCQSRRPSRCSCQTCRMGAGLSSPPLVSAAGASRCSAQSRSS